VVIWELSDTGAVRRDRTLRLTASLSRCWRCTSLSSRRSRSSPATAPGHSPGGIAWTAITAVAMFVLAAGKTRTGAALDNPVLRTEGRVTIVDGLWPLPFWPACS
jgi:hypothetical protein